GKARWAETPPSPAAAYKPHHPTVRRRGASQQGRVFVPALSLSQAVPARNRGTATPGGRRRRPPCHGLRLTPRAARDGRSAAGKRGKNAQRTEELTRQTDDIHWVRQRKESGK